MSISEDIKNLGEEIVASYELRLKAIGEIVGDTHKMLDEFRLNNQELKSNNQELFGNVHKMLSGFQADHKEMSAQLRASLSKGEEDRISAFKAMMGDIENYVAELSKNTAEFIIAIADVRKIMAEKLRLNLSKEEETRISNFKVMIGDIENYVADLSKNTADQMNVIGNERKAMAQKLDADLSKGEEDRIKDFTTMITNVKNSVKKIIRSTAKLMAEIQKDQKGRNKGVADLLKRFANEHKVMANELNKNLAKGETDRLGEFQKMMVDIQKYVEDVVNITKKLMDEIRARQDERNNEVLGLLQEFKTAREKMASNWKTLNDTMARLRSGKTIVEKKVKVRTVKEAIEEEKPKPEPEKPVEKPTPKPKPAKKVQPGEKDIPIEDKVLAYINAHPKGVQVGDMEEPLGVIRMRLGVVAKKLLDAGKVKKVDKEYFPV